MTKSIALGAAMAAALTSTAAFAEITANIGVASTYLWRGQDLGIADTNANGSQPQVSGGVDYAHESGFYAGLWQSSEGFTSSPETDLYIGFAGEVEDISYDVGFVSYMYFQDEVNDPAGGDRDFEEVYFGVGFGPASLFYANDSDNDTTYFSLSGEYEMFTVTYGDFAFDTSPASDYTHFDISVALTDELSLTYSKTDVDNSEPLIVVSYGLEFEVD